MSDHMDILIYFYTSYYIYKKKNTIFECVYLSP